MYPRVRMKPVRNGPASLPAGIGNIALAGMMTWATFSYSIHSAKPGLTNTSATTYGAHMAAPQCSLAAVCMAS